MEFFGLKHRDIHRDRLFQKPVFYDQEGHRNDVGPLNFFFEMLDNCIPI